MTTLLAKNATLVVTMDGERRELRDAGLFARDGFIEQVALTSELPVSADTVLDLRDQILLPGLVNCHHHLDQVLTRNLPRAQNTDLFPWLRALYPVLIRRTPDASRTATIIGLAELALSGCTTSFDHTYIFQNGCTLDDQIHAARELGVRFVAARGGVSLGGLLPDTCVEKESVILADSHRLIQQYHTIGCGSMLQIVLAPGSLFSVTADMMRESASLAREYGVRLHTHLCETADEERYMLEHFQMRPVAYLDTLGWIADDVWYAHAIHVNDEEIRLFGQRGTGVCHCPSSNMRLASGIAPVKKYLECDVKVGIGVDGSASNDSSNLLLEVREALLLARLKMGLFPPEGSKQPFPSSDPLRTRELMTAREALEIATRGGAQVLGRSDIGALEPGKCADFFTLDLNTVGYAGALSDPVAAVVFCAPQHAYYTVVGGCLIVDKGEIATLNLDSVIREHNCHAAALASEV
ncbi:8-oxoguanine deaminase [Ktedonospora formicarum]|uniref:8-oxoguanine deaminase n=1 Tax=Ktedonospora formicarum TaxID=2778364 RepID=A0A8J3I6A7_9CHLR|nr:8-oxoguanine deaminase [Ktedonospora formicarum]GHO51137.1 8-oxoguanine deaminase [Ktedonospora formicarum]